MDTAAGESIAANHVEAGPKIPVHRSEIPKGSEPWHKTPNAVNLDPQGQGTL